MTKKNTRKNHWHNHQRQLILQAVHAWRWWTKELASLLPTGLRDKFSASHASVVARLQNNAATVYLHAGSRQSALATLTLDQPATFASSATRNAIKSAVSASSAMIIELCDEQVLSQTVRLPAAVGDNLSNVMRFEMDRLTPFDVEQVYFSYRVSEFDKKSDHLNVELTVAPKRIVDPVLDSLSDFGLVPSMITVANDAQFDTTAYQERVNLLPRQLRQERESRDTTLLRGLLIGVVTLGLVALLMPFYLRNVELEQLDQQIVQVKQTAQRAASTRDLIESTIRQSNFLFAKRLKTITTVALLDEITRVIPDDTWVARMEANGTRLRIQGESESASALIGLVEASPMFSDVSFFSPVTKNPRTGNDRFALEAQIRVSESET